MTPRRSVHVTKPLFFTLRDRTPLFFLQNQNAPRGAHR